MIGLYKYIESPFGEKTYFAGANSGVGFVNLSETFTKNRRSTACT